MLPLERTGKVRQIFFQGFSWYYHQRLTFPCICHLRFSENLKRIKKDDLVILFWKLFDGDVVAGWVIDTCKQLEWALGEDSLWQTGNKWGEKWYFSGLFPHCSSFFGNSPTCQDLDSPYQFGRPSTMLQMNPRYISWWFPYGRCRTGQHAIPKTRARLLEQFVPPWPGSSVFHLISHK